jgi:hypothetical protein
MSGKSAVGAIGADPSAVAPAAKAEGVAGAARLRKETSLRPPAIETCLI